MGYAEVISLANIRARKQWESLRQALHERFDQWLDNLEAGLPEPEATLAQVSDLVWRLRQDLTGGLAETLLTHAHASEQNRNQAPCPQCHRRLTARPAVARTVETMVGPVQLERPYFYCDLCRQGFYPFDEAVGLSQGRIQLDVQQAAAELTIELPYETASAMLARLSGLSVSSERLHTLTNQVAEGLEVLDVMSLGLTLAPTRQEIDRLVAQVAAGRFRRPVLVLSLDGAYVPSRPESARGSRPGQARQRARRARWTHEWREAKGFRFYLLDGERIVHVLSWHQVQSEAELAHALKQIKSRAQEI